MENWVRVGAEEMLASGAMQEVQVEERTLLLARVGASYYATQARCPHLRGHLARGTLAGIVVTEAAFVHARSTWFRFTSKDAD